LTFDTRKQALAHVKRAFYCRHRCEGVSPDACQRCWLTGKAPGFIRTHAECIESFRVIAIRAFNRGTLDPVEEAIWTLLYDELKAVGEEEAIVADKIIGKLKAPERGAFPLNDRSLRDSILRMAAKGHLIVSTVHKPFGFFIPKDEQEVIAYMGNLAARKHALDARQEVCMEFIHPPGKQLGHLGIKTARAQE